VLTFLHPLQPIAVAYIGSGLIVGAAVGWFALRHTQFEATPEGYFYTPHLYIGIAVTALFVGRLLYRIVLVYDTMGHAGAAPTPDNNPLTLGILFLTASYYIVYCIGLLRWLREAQRAPGVKLPSGAPDGASSTSV
jgi:cytochrome b561